MRKLILLLVVLLSTLPNTATIAQDDSQLATALNEVSGITYLRTYRLERAGDGTGTIAYIEADVLAGFNNAETALALYVAAYVYARNTYGEVAFLPFRFSTILWDGDRLPIDWTWDDDIQSWRTTELITIPDTYYSAAQAAIGNELRSVEGVTYLRDFRIEQASTGTIATVQVDVAPGYATADTALAFYIPAFYYARDTFGDAFLPFDFSAIIWDGETAPIIWHWLDDQQTWDTTATNYPTTGYGGTDNSVVTTNPTALPPPTAVPPTPTQPPIVGTPITIDGIRIGESYRYRDGNIRITEVIDPFISTNWTRPRDGNRAIAIWVELTCTLPSGSFCQPMDVYLSDLELMDGRLLERIDMVSLVNGTEQRFYNMTTVNGGDTFTGVVWLEVPADARYTRISAFDWTSLDTVYFSLID